MRRDLHDMIMGALIYYIRILFCIVFKCNYNSHSIVILFIGDCKWGVEVGPHGLRPAPGRASILHILDLVTHCLSELL